jgi:DNA polymerase V
MKYKLLSRTGQLDFYTVSQDTEREIPLMSSRVSAGFPSPADDYIELSLDLNKALIDNPSATFYARVKGMSMQDAGIEDGDLLIIDRSRAPYNGATAVCFLNGDFTAKKIKISGTKVWLMPANEAFQPLEVKEDQELIIWGIITYVIKKMG